ncbi:MAG TPA: Wzz/FepE/Etk N-terminal domain-containing protein [Bacillales bacterium]
MEETISLKEIFATIKKRIWMILFITVIATAATGITSYFIMTPIYEAETQILVQSESDSDEFDYSQVQTNLKLVNTYSVIVKSPRILEKVVDELDLDKDVGQLQHQLSVNNEENSQVLNIAVTSPEPSEAVQLANTIAEVFQDQIVNIMSVDNVSILSKADLGAHPQPVKPNPLLNMGIAFVVGLTIGLGLAFLLEYLDNTIKTEQDIEKLLGLPVLGAVTEIDLEQHNTQSRVAKRRVESENFGS